MSREQEGAKFSVSQLVRVVDQSSPHNDLIGSLIVVTSEKDGVFYRLRFGPNQEGGLFREGSLRRRPMAAGGFVAAIDIMLLL